MASKFGLAGGLPERRVRPIWDAIDSRQFKNALKLVTALLTKYPNSAYALALKALVLERMGKNEEALSVCLNAKELMYKNDLICMDELTLSTLQIVFQRLDHLDLATSCYEHACGKFPNNLELLMGLFNCYVREYSYVKQQQIAIKMYKISGEERYLLWAVCSIQLQVLCGNGGNKLLLLAEGLLKKHIVSHSLHEPEALNVYVSILEKQSKFGDALEVLSGNLGSLLVIEVDKLRLQGRLLARAGDYAAASDIFMKVLKLCPDDWEGFLQYLGCLLEDDSSWSDADSIDPVHRPNLVKCKLSHLADEMLDSRSSAASAYMEKLQEGADSDRMRCPYLAKLEIERRKYLVGKGSDEQFLEALMQYFTRFGHLACFASDVEPFLEVLTPDIRIELLDKMRKSFETSAAPTKMIGWTTSFYKVQEFIGDVFNLPVAEVEASSLQMVEMFCKHLPLSRDLDSKENMYGEELLSVASVRLVQLFWRTKRIGYLLEAIMVLEFGLGFQRYCWKYAISLLHLYSFFGALPLAYARYKSLDVKNILMESVLHHILPQMLRCPHWEDLENLLQEYLKFMDDYLRESAEFTFLAYRHRNYSKAIEFVQFKERLQHSTQYILAKIESCILQLKQNAGSIETLENILISSKCEFDEVLKISQEAGDSYFTFNEDLQQRPWWTPSADKNYLSGTISGLPSHSKENLIKEREDDIKWIIRRRSGIPRLIHLAVQCTSSLLKEKSGANGSPTHLEASLELRSLLERYATALGYTYSDAILFVSKLSCDESSTEGVGSNIVDWLNFAVFLNAWDLNCHEVRLFAGDGSVLCTLDVVNSLLTKYIHEKMKFMACSSSSRGDDVAYLVQLVTEPLAWHSLVIQSCVRSSLPSNKKKKKTGPTGQPNPQLIERLRKSIMVMSSMLDQVIRWLQEHINKPDDERVDVLHPAFPMTGHLHEGPGKIFNLLEAFRCSSMNDPELGAKFTEVLQNWSSLDVLRKAVNGEKETMSKFLCICEAKSKSLQALYQQIPQA
ncbi:hypothetical protein QQ045_016978 [Rhodiola kirilowii]